MDSLHHHLILNILIVNVVFVYWKECNNLLDQLVVIKYVYHAVIKINIMEIEHVQHVEDNHGYNEYFADIK